MTPEDEYHKHRGHGTFPDNSQNSNASTSPSLHHLLRIDTWWRLLSEVLVLQFLHQLLLVGVVLVELDEVGDSICLRLIILDFGWRHALESVVDSGCQLDHVALLLGLKLLLSRGLAWILSHTKHGVSPRCNLNSLNFSNHTVGRGRRWVCPFR